MKHALRTVVLAVLSLAFCNGLIAQAKPSPVVSALLTRARTQEQTGHIDLAAQTWQRQRGDGVSCAPSAGRSRQQPDCDDREHAEQQGAICRVAACGRVGSSGAQ
jgi:hypothetical protein